QVARIQLREHLTGGRRRGRTSCKQAPAAETFLGCNSVQRFMQGNIFLARHEPGFSLPAEKLARKPHLLKLLSRATIATPPYAWRSNSRFDDRSAPHERYFPRWRGEAWALPESDHKLILIRRKLRDRTITAARPSRLTWQFGASKVRSS